MIRKFLSAITLFGLLFQPPPLHAQYDDNLYPEDGPFSRWQGSYENDVRKLLSRGMRDEPLAFMACLPSFTPEWVVYIQQPHPQPRSPYPRDMLSFFVVCEEANTQIWQTVLENIAHDPEARHHVKTSLSIKKIPDDDAQIVVRAFLAVLAKTKYSGKPGVSIDGVRYHFSARDEWRGVNMYGQSVNPAKDSSPGTLVALGKTMAEYSRTSAKGGADSLLARMRTIAGRLTR